MHSRLGALPARLQAVTRSCLRTGQARSLAIVAAGGVAAVAVTARRVTGPLRELRGAMERVAAGDASARTPVAGAREVRDAAQVFNTLMDQKQRFHGQEAERSRLRALALAAGQRIRNHLQTGDVINEARAVIENDLGTDAAYLHLVDETGKFGLPIGHEHDWLMPADFIETMPRETLAVVEGLFRSGGSMVIQDMTGPEGEALPPQVRQAVRAAGIVSHLLTPFGGDTGMLGVIAAERLSRGRPWTPAEIEAVESIAADIGRGLHHARLYETEQHLGQHREGHRAAADPDR